jgi:hypothetical protein
MCTCVIDYIDKEIKLIYPELVYQFDNYYKIYFFNFKYLRSDVLDKINKIIENFNTSIRPGCYECSHHGKEFRITDKYF